MTKQINGDKLFVIDPHPAIPPSDQLKKWEDKWFNEEEHADVLLIQAFQAGADQELEACCEWVGCMFHGHKTWSDELRAARRPKPPSLKEQALKDLTVMTTVPPGMDPLSPETTERISRIRRALEALPE
jgi:hypothetical protein